MPLTRIAVTPDSSAIREEEFEGRTHMVVPLVALVEGVLHSANADKPELAPASEFGKFPQGWDGRPVVMGHPKVNGLYVSANSPNVLKDWSIGQLFNTRVEDKKLKTEAWIDIARANTLNSDSKALITRLQSGEMVEVSTGLFVEVTNIHGIYEGEQFFGIWSDVVPDHLAMLAEGTIGACSVEDGCGAPRLNVAESAKFRGVQLTAQGCACGGNCCGKEATVSKNKDGEHTDGDETIEAANRYNARVGELMELTFPEARNLQANEFPGDMPVENVRMLLRNALDAREDIDLFMINTFTREQVVFEVWEDLKFRSMNFNITDEGSVEFTSDPVEVNLLTRIAPRVNANDGDESMADDGKKAAASPSTAEPKPNEQAQEPPAQEPKAQEYPPTQPLKVSSVKDLLTSEVLDPAVKAQIEKGQRLMQEKIDADVKEVLANKRNTFTEDELKAMDPDVLNKMAQLAREEQAQPQDPEPATQQDFTGRAAPTQTRVQEDPNVPPPAPEAFPRVSRSNGQGG